VLVWAFALALGAGPIIHPKLGTSVRAEGGETPTDFMTAVYAGGSSISVVAAAVVLLASLMMTYIVISAEHP
jgi:hypothetical protein